MKKGAFTGAIVAQKRKSAEMELADQGTLFLDEVGDIPVEFQPEAVARNTKSVNLNDWGALSHPQSECSPRIAATNRDLETNDRGPRIPK